MSRGTPASKKKANKARKRRHKRRMQEAAEKKRAEKARQKRRPEPTSGVAHPWPDTTGLSEEEATRVWSEYYYWEDYYDRNPESRFAAPVSWPVQASADGSAPTKRRRRKARRA